MNISCKLFILLTFLIQPFSALAQDAPLVVGSTLDAKQLVQGGRIAFGSFKPGPGAEANDELDAISENLVKGIKDRLLASSTSLQVIEDAIKADFLLDGYIEQLSKTGKMSRLMGNKQAYLAIDGEIWSQETGVKILVFSSARVVNLKKTKLNAVAYQIGEGIADYIIGQVKRGDL